MSIIVVVKKAGRAVIASDSLSKTGSSRITSNYRNTEKIIPFNNSYIGITGPSAHLSVFRHLVANHSDKISLNSEQEIFNTYLKIHSILKDEYYINTDEYDDNNTYESSQIDGLIINPSGIFGMYSWREAFEYKKFWALGSGFDFAMGAMYSTFDLYDEPEKIAEIGIKAACEFDDSCGLPMNTYSVELINND
jgi:ATP-dependent protease HslVU (ClpYQ) peptidase subunit